MYLKGFVYFLLGILFFLSPGAYAAQDQNANSEQNNISRKVSVSKPISGECIKHDTSLPLTLIPAKPFMKAEEDEVENTILPNKGTAYEGRSPDPVVQSSPFSSDIEVIPNIPSPIVNFDGMSNINGFIPPDTNGDVGPNHYVQTVNMTFAVYNKDGTVALTPRDINTIWTGFGGLCETTNRGDPIVHYDQLAGRWLISQFAFSSFYSPPYYQCIAISQNSDPTGAYYRYAFLISNTHANDYPKFGVWPDGYYMSINQFEGGISPPIGGSVVFERDKMILGQTARFVKFDVANDWGQLPSDLDGSTLPPAGAPNYFADFEPNAFHLWKFHVDWANVGNSTFTEASLLSVAPFDSSFSCVNGRGCIPQKGTTQKVDALSDRFMARLFYRKFPTYESLVTNHTVDVDTNHAGVRWYEVRNPGTSPVVYQQGTYAPDANHRWMGSIGMDASGDIALGYSISNTDMYPSIRYTGRLVSDPLGTLPQGEGIIIAGGGSQTNTAARWGDYSAISIDPIDNCTFWYTTEYYATTGGSNWRTRIGSFKFPSCQSGTQTPYPPGPRAIPGLIETEEFDLGGEGVAYHDNEPANLGGQFRTTEGVDITTTADTGGGYIVGWVVSGEWLEYTVNVATAGTYTLEARVASLGTGGTFHVEFNGVNKTGSIAIPNTGGWDTWTTLRKNVSLSAGNNQIMRIAMDTVGPSGFVGNFNKIRLAQYQGYVDGADCQNIWGWAWDKGQPNTPISVDISKDGNPPTTQLANLFRQDLLDAGIGNGYHAFVFPVPSAWKDGIAHSISVKYSGTNDQLIGSPKTITCGGGGGTPVNVALASNGGIATASSTFNSNYPPAAVNNGDRKGLNWAAGGGWNDATAGVFPDWIQVDFNGTKTINEIDVFTIQDNYSNPVDPTPTMTFSLYGITAFDVQYWNGSTWVTVPGGSVTGNNFVWRKFTFSNIATSKIRVTINNALNSYSRVVELEAWSPPNVALASNGGVASASSTFSTNYPPAAVTNGDRKGLNWGAGGGWNDATAGVYPDWIQVDFSGTKPINEIDVFTLQDNLSNPVEPTPTLTFGLYGITAFDVQYWNGSSWVTVPGGSVTGNNLVWRRFTFSAISTSKIRVLINNALYSYSRVVELEAYAQ